MKNINAFLRKILLVVPLFAMVSCEDFLSTEPDSTRATLKTPEQVSQLLTTAYPQGGYLVFGESMSDNAGDKGAGYDDKINRGSYFYEVVEAAYDYQDSPDYYWAGAYKAIAVANQALKVISESANPEAYSAQKGEALVARAYAHFMLVSFYSRFYNPPTAATDPGIPYVTEPEEVVNKKYERKTVAYVYEMIEKDLLAGMPLIKESSYAVPKYHFNVAAANAFASRFYLVKRDYAKVLQYSNNVFPGGDVAGSLRPWNSTYQNMTYTSLFKTYSRATENANLLLVETGSFFGGDVYAYRYALTNAIWDEISSVIGVSSSTADWSFSTYTAGEGNLFIPKLSTYFVKSSINAEVGYPYVMVPLFTTEEVLFNRAEANIYLGNSNAVLADLNVYASKRIRNYNATNHNITLAKIRTFYGLTNTTANNNTGLLRTVADFRRLEFTQEGQRWFDILRYGLEVTHTTTNGQTITLPNGDPRRQLQLPQSVVLSGIELNKR